MTDLTTKAKEYVAAWKHVMALGEDLASGMSASGGVPVYAVEIGGKFYGLHRNFARGPCSLPVGVSDVTVMTEATCSQP